VAITRLDCHSTRGRCGNNQCKHQRNPRRSFADDASGSPPEDKKKDIPAIHCFWRV
jgi:hypothetical protein